MKINCSHITFNNKPKCLLRKTDNHTVTCNLCSKIIQLDIEVPDNFHSNEEQSMMILNKVYEVENSNVHN